MAAPDESRALAALKIVQSLSRAQLDALLAQEIGAPMLGVLNSLARVITGAKTDAELGPVVHCMVLAYLLHREVAPRA